MLEGVDYLPLYGNEPSAIEMVYAIFANVMELDENCQVLNVQHAQKRATDYLRAYCDPNFKTKYKNDIARTDLARTRPLCPYPGIAKYKGSGSIDDAANFVCQAPKE
jgi:Tannase and feruloyl esterase